MAKIIIIINTFCSCRRVFPNYVQRVHSSIPRVHLFYLLCHFKSSLIKSQECRLQRSVEESLLQIPPVCPKREWDSSVCNSLVSREPSLMVGVFSAIKRWVALCMPSCIFMPMTPSFTPWVPLKLSLDRSLAAEGPADVRDAVTTAQGRRNKPCQVPGPGQTKSGARCSIGLEYTRLYRAEEERLLRSARAVTVLMEREHAPCSMEAMEKLEQNTQQSLS